MSFVVLLLTLPACIILHYFGGGAGVFVKWYIGGPTHETLSADKRLISVK